MQHHIASSKRSGLTAEDWKNLKNPSAAPFSEKEKTALAFAEKLTRTPQAISDSDVNGLKKFYSDAEIMEIDLLVGLINLTNRFTDPLGLELEMAAVQI
jgi:alkylhydroperoxidase family enzyme